MKKIILPLLAATLLMLLAVSGVFAASCCSGGAVPTCGNCPWGGGPPPTTISAGLPSCCQTGGSAGPALQSRPLRFAPTGRSAGLPSCCQTGGSSGPALQVRPLRPAPITASAGLPSCCQTGGSAGPALQARPMGPALNGPSELSWRPTTAVKPPKARHVKRGPVRGTPAAVSYKAPAIRRSDIQKPIPAQALVQPSLPRPVMRLASVERDDAPLLSTLLNGFRKPSVKSSDRPVAPILVWGQPRSDVARPAEWAKPASATASTVGPKSEKTQVAGLPSCCVGGSGPIKPLGGKLPATGSFFNSPAYSASSFCTAGCCSK